MKSQVLKCKPVLILADKDMGPVWEIILETIELKFDARPPHCSLLSTSMVSATFNNLQ